MKEKNIIRPLDLFSESPNWQKWILLVIAVNLVAYSAVGSLDATAGFYRNSIADPQMAGVTIGILMVFSLIEIAFRKILVAGMIITSVIGGLYAIAAFGNSIHGTKGWIDSIVLVASTVGMLALSAFLLHYLSLSNFGQNRCKEGVQALNCHELMERT